MILLCVPLAGVPVWYDSTSSCIISNCPRLLFAYAFASCLVAVYLPMPLLRVRSWCDMRPALGCLVLVCVGCDREMVRLRKADSYVNRGVTGDHTEQGRLNNRLK